MKKNGILNSEISKCLSDLGHTDSVTISDCGLPIPKDVKRIDLALKFGVPSFLETLKEVYKDMEIEKIILAKEIKTENLLILDGIYNIFGKEIDIEFVSHNKFKELTKESKAIIRTGEASPYANIILISNCIF